MTEPESPLLSTSPDALSALFAADPVKLEDPELRALITELRRRRSAFRAEEAAKSLKPAAKRAKAETQSAPAAAALDKPTSEISLDDI